MNRALIVKKHWLDKILANEKPWEVRGSNTNIRETIGLIESGSGLVVGECELVDSIKLDWDVFEKNIDKHCVSSRENVPYDTPYAWVNKNAKRYDKPIPYKHPQGAVIWVKLKDNLINV